MNQAYLHAADGLGGNVALVRLVRNALVGGGKQGVFSLAQGLGSDQDQKLKVRSFMSIFVGSV